jgi:thymidylate kinase
MELIESSQPAPAKLSDRIRPDDHLITEPTALTLVLNVCLALAEEDIAYCHWKSTNALDRSARGENDLDLLISRNDAPRFTELLCRLGFKQVKAPPENQMPGVLDYFGYDAAADRMVHVHAHYQLILGHDLTKNYRLPIEKPYLDSAVQGALFKVPAPEFEFIVFVIRMALKHSTWDAILGREGALNAGERRELAYLQARINQDRIASLLQRHLPYISIELFNNCLQALQLACPAWSRAKVSRELQTQLQASAQYDVSIEPWLKLWRRGALFIRRRVFKSTAKYRLDTGGAVIAIVGGDGAGKSTAVEALYDWLSKHFEADCVHLGKPAWSWVTIAIRGVLKSGQLLGLYPVETSAAKTIQQASPVSPGYPWLVREVCTARDRYWAYVKARRFAARGGLIICDRFPLPQIQIMDGPQTRRFIHQLMDGPQAQRLMSPRSASRLAKFLVRQEESYYHQMTWPELVIVLRVDPEIAVQRKTDEEATSVRERSTAIWRQTWEGTDAHLIDASQSKAAVLAKLKALIWSEL